MTPPKRRDKSAKRSVERPEDSPGLWRFVILAQIALAVLALTADPGTRTAARAQGTIVVLTPGIIVTSLMGMPWVGFTNVVRRAYVVSLVLGVASLVVVVDMSRDVYMGPAALMGALFALSIIGMGWRARSRQ